MHFTCSPAKKTFSNIQQAIAIFLACLICLWLHLSNYRRRKAFLSKCLYVAFTCMLSLILLDTNPWMAIPELHFWGLALLCFLWKVSAVPASDCTSQKQQWEWSLWPVAAGKNVSPHTHTFWRILAWLCSFYVLPSAYCAEVGVEGVKILVLVVSDFRKL